MNYKWVIKYSLWWVGRDLNFVSLVYLYEMLYTLCCLENLIKDIIREWPYWSNYRLKGMEPVKKKIDGRKDNSCLWYTHDYNSGRREHVAVTSTAFCHLGRCLIQNKIVRPVHHVYGL